VYSKEDIEFIKNIILEQIKDISYIYLFGSYAVNNANEKSDIDIAILLKKKIGWKERKNILNYLYRKTSERGLEVDFMVKTENGFNKDKTLPTLSKTIYEKGKLLWKFR